MTHIKKNAILLCITVLVLVFPACGALPAESALMPPAVEVSTTTPVETVEMVVIAEEGLRVRSGPDWRAKETGEILLPGQVVIVTEIMLDLTDTQWCKHERGWSACRYLKEDESQSVRYNKDKEK